MNEVLTQSFNSNKGQDGLLDQPGFKLQLMLPKYVRKLKLWVKFLNDVDAV